MGMAKNTRKRGREQAGMSREGRRTMEKVLENTVRDTLQERIRGKNSSGTIVFVYHPIISRAPTQVHQVKDDDEEKKDVSSGTHWGKKVSVEKDVSSLRCNSRHCLAQPR